MKKLFSFSIVLMFSLVSFGQGLELSETLLTFTENLDDEPGFDYGEVSLTNTSSEPITVIARLELRCHPMGEDSTGVQFCVPGFCLGPYDYNIQAPSVAFFTLEPGASTSELTGKLWYYEGVGSAYRIYYRNETNVTDEVYIDLVFGECASEFVIVGIEENEAATLSVYPNPARDVLNVTTDIAPGTLYTVYDMTGRTVAAGQINASTMRIDVSELTGGQYIIEMAASRVRFVVQ